MDFDKNQLCIHIIDALRNRDNHALVRHFLRFLVTFDDNIVYIPDGVAKTLQGSLGISKTTSHRVLEGLEARNILTRLDEFSLQLNDQFSTKGGKPARYQGDRIVYTAEEQDLLRKLMELRNVIWAARGKNKRRVKTESKEIEMNAFIQTLTKQLDAKDRQIDKKDEQIAKLMSLVDRIACGETVTATEAKRHLQLVGHD